MVNEDMGFLGSLFDFSFSTFVTAKLIKVLYVLGLILACLVALSMVLSGFGIGFAAGVVSLILAPVVFLFIAMYIRVVMEVLIVLFRISENVARIADRGTQQG